jgi:hypothetical protein
MMMAYGKDYEVSYTVSINFRANLDAQNAGNCISGLQISNIFCASMPPHTWPSVIAIPLYNKK